MKKVLSNGDAAEGAMLYSVAQAFKRPQSFPIAIGVLLLAALSVPALVSLHGIWLTPTYSHGYLVLIIVFPLLAAHARRAPLEPVSTSWIGLLCLSGLVAFTIVGLASTTLIVAQVALPLLWMAGAWTFIGVANARRFILPFCFLYFAIPVWDAGVGFLQGLTVRVVSACIRMVGMPAFIDGNLIHIPSGTFEVQGGCAGLRYVIVALTLAALLAFMRRLTWRALALLSVFALGLALVANWLRVFTIVTVGYVYEMRHFLIAREHDDFGMALFAVCLVPLFILDRKLAPACAQPASPGSTSNARLAVSSVRQSTLTMYLALAVLGLGALLNYVVNRDGEPPPGTVVVRPPEVAGWERVADWQDERTPLFFGPTAHAAAWYADGDLRVGAYLAHYAVQQPNREVVVSQNDPEGDEGTVVSRRRITVETASAGALSFQELEILDARVGPRLAWVGLRVAGRPASSDLAAKALQVAGAIGGRRDAQALVLTATCRSDCTEARAALSSYASAAVDAWFDEAEVLYRSVDGS